MNNRLLIVACMVLFVALIHVCKVSCMPNKESQPEMGRLLTHIRDAIPQLREKRVCHGYMCSQSHISGHAGGITLQQALYKYYLECSKNPYCSPPSRKRRQLADASHVKSAIPEGVSTL
uniref:Uncharacterized protein n=1 Tax=Arion vulgaris TaxID=1028688 RepID=A0A0B6Z4P9_9EUPU